MSVSYLRSRMKDRLRFFGLLSLFWLTFFVFSRILFLVYLYNQTAALSLNEILTPLVLGLRMDGAMTGYWMLITGLVFTASPFISNRIVFIIQGGFTIFFLIICSIIVVADMELYKHWGFRINSTPLMYIGPEAAGSVSVAVLVGLVLLFTALFVTFLWIYWKRLAPTLKTLSPLEKRWSPVWLLLTAALIIPIRSSFSVAPLNTGFVYFHKTKAFPNHAGINPVWNFLKSVTQDERIHYPESFYREYETEFKTLMHSEGKTSPLISQEKPNVILIILESFTAKIIEPLGGLPNVTPQLNALTNEGILFTNFYASGDRTDKGIVSILSGYPAQPRTSIIKYPNKTQSLPYLPKALERMGYHTSFVYGGDIGFANMESYLTNAGFSHITQDDDFESDIDHSKWGIADHYVFNQLLAECDTAQRPFFKVMLSLSSHEPFEVPMKTVFEGKDESSKFLNSCFYTDKSLGEFIHEAKQKDWWNNTLIIITADHGHRFPNPKELKEKERFKIPMLWMGGAIAKQDTLIHTFGVQTDLANTLLHQFGTPAHDFTFSKNMMAADAKSFALYVFNNGFGYVAPGHETIYDFDLKNYLKKEGYETELPYGKAYMQKLFHDYNAR
jgi:phosphoglycerol transferase MdoB-like AlkP superfamily enzyme